MKAPLSASSQLIKTTFSQKAADRIMKFHTIFWFLKDKKVIQPEKSCIFGKKPEISLKVGLLELAENLFH